MRWISNDDGSLTKIHEPFDNDDIIVNEFFEFCRNPSLVKKALNDDELFRKHCHMLKRAQRMTCHLVPGQEIDRPLKNRITVNCGGLDVMRQFNDICKRVK